MSTTSRRGVTVPLCAGVLAIAYPAAAMAGVWAVAAVTVIAAVAVGALVLVRRPSPVLGGVLVAMALWLAAGLAGALLMPGHGLLGAMWVLLALYLLPLPVVPYLYARTFDDPEKQVKGKRGERKGTAGVTRIPGRRRSSLFPFPASLFPLRSRRGPAQTSEPKSQPTPGDTR